MIQYRSSNSKYFSFCHAIYQLGAVFLTCSIMKLFQKSGPTSQKFLVSKVSFWSSGHVRFQSQVNTTINQNYLIQIFNFSIDIITSFVCRCSVREHKYFLNFHIIVNHVYHRVSGILASFHPDVDLRDCPVLVTQPPPTIVHTDNSGRDGEAGANPAYVTSDTKHHTVAAAIMLLPCLISRIL